MMINITRVVDFLLSTSDLCCLLIYERLNMAFDDVNLLICFVNVIDFIFNVVLFGTIANSKTCAYF